MQAISSDVMDDVAFAEGAAVLGSGVAGTVVGSVVVGTVVSSGVGSAVDPKVEGAVVTSVGGVVEVAGVGGGEDGSRVSLDAISEVGTGVEFKVTDGKVGVVVEAAGVAPIVLVRYNTSITTPMTTRRTNKPFPNQCARNKGR